MPVHCVTGWHSKAANTWNRTNTQHTLYCMGTPQTCSWYYCCTRQLSNLHQLCREACTAVCSSNETEGRCAVHAVLDMSLTHVLTSLYNNNSMVFTEKDPLSTDDTSCSVHRPNLTDWPSLSGQNLTMVPFEANGVKFCIHLT